MFIYGLWPEIKWYYYYYYYYSGSFLLIRWQISATTLERSYFLVWSARLSDGGNCHRRQAPAAVFVADASSRKMRVLAHFTIHMVEIIQLYTYQPHTWLGFRHHPSSSVFQPYVWLGTISNSWNNTK